MTLDLTLNTPFAIAFTGGGDSTALVHKLKDRAPKPFVFIVDHGLRDGARAEALLAQSFAQSLGLEARVLTWTHNNPSTGLQEKARKARYGLLGQACRDAGINYLLTAHTEDDQAETLLMRYDRQTDWRGAAGIAGKTYAPVWPELADVTIVRPLLGAARDGLRAYNREHNLTWSEDPSNQNPAYARIRARQHLGANPKLSRLLLDAASSIREGVAAENARSLQQLKDHVEMKHGLARVNISITAHLLGHILRAVSGSGGPLDQAKLSRLAKAMRDKSFRGATLGGGRVHMGEQGFIIGPDPGIYAGRRNGAAINRAKLTAGRSFFWQGRYEIRLSNGGGFVYPACQIYDVLDPDMARALRTSLQQLPSMFRETFPVILTDEGDVYTVFDAEKHSKLTFRDLVAPRLHRVLEV